jgi:hypothetical protein
MSSPSRFNDLIFKEKTVAVPAARLSEPLGIIKARIRRGLLKLCDTLTRSHD